MLTETSYGIAKRFRFITEEVSEAVRQLGGNIKIADIGCGSGSLLTIPLAQSFQENVTIYAYEPDEVSLKYLQTLLINRQVTNIVPVDKATDLGEDFFDIVIASEVVEHVEDPTAFLLFLKSILKKNGKMILTLPNGFGIFELDTLLYNALELIGIISLLRNLILLKYTIFRRAKNRKTENIRTMDTLAYSPHLQFFTISQIRHLIESLNFRVDRIEGRTLLCGNFVSRFLENKPKFLKINNMLGSYLPLSLVSGWMIVSSLDSAERNISNTRADYQEWRFQRLYSNFKRYINLKVGDRYNKRGLIPNSDPINFDFTSADNIGDNQPC